MKNLKLFDRYQAQSKAEWLKLVQNDLKTDDLGYLAWEAASGIKVQPYYNQEDLKSSIYPAYAYDVDQQWQNLEKIVVENPVEANKFALKALNAGADGIIFDISDEDTDLNSLLQNILLQHCSVYFSGKADISLRFLK